jgi:uncharacterized protein
MLITWSPWHPAAFARARAESKPVLLSISAAWCHWCHEMDRTSYSDPAVVRLVNDRFVAVRVDADRRPDINERYGLGGLPTTAFLTPDGEVVGGGTYVPVERMSGVLEQVADAFASRRDEIVGRAKAAAGTPRGRRTTSRPTHESLIQMVFQTFDAEHGGFGTEPKFPLTAPLHLALDLYASTSDHEMRTVVGCTLDAMASRGLYDEVDGGFFRYATTRDWQLPHHEKLLDVNAALLKAFVDGAAALNAARYRDLAADVVRYLQTWLADTVDGGWAGSQEADHVYYAVHTPDARAAMAQPCVDRTLYSDWNAAMVSAALHAAYAMHDTGLGEFAIRSLERLLLACYQPGAGVAHYFDDAPHVRGLLDDQIAMATAALDAAEATGKVPYEMMAEELGLYVLRTMWDEHDGGFFDRAPPPEAGDVGLLCEPVKPFVSNCEAARLFSRLAASSGDNDFAEKARQTISSLEPFAMLEGPLAAHYLLAVREAGLR